MSKLADHLLDSGITQAAFAESVGASQGTISKIIRGVRSPSLRLAVRIERATQGRVSAASLLPAPDSGERAQREASGAVR